MSTNPFRMHLSSEKKGAIEAKVWRAQIPEEALASNREALPNARQVTSEVKLSTDSFPRLGASFCSLVSLLWGVLCYVFPLIVSLSSCFYINGGREKGHEASIKLLSHSNYLLLINNNFCMLCTNVYKFNKKIFASFVEDARVAMRKQFRQEVCCKNSIKKTRD